MAKYQQYNPIDARFLFVQSSVCNIANLFSKLVAGCSSSSSILISSLSSLSEAFSDCSVIVSCSESSEYSLRTGSFCVSMSDCLAWIHLTVFTSGWFSQKSGLYYQTLLI